MPVAEEKEISTQTALSQSAIALLALGLLTIIILVRGFLSRSFWLDETITAWIISDTWQDAFQRSSEFQGQTPLYYLLMCAWAQVWGASEFSLRIPSVLAVAVCANIFFRFLKQRFDLLFAACATGLFISLDATQLALCARPYGMALLCSTAATLELLRACDQQKLKVSYLLWMTAAIYLHFLAAVMLFVHMLILCVKNRALIKSWIIHCLMLGALLLPSFPQFLSLQQRSSDLFFLGTPSLFDFFRALLPIPVLVYIAIPLALVAVLYWKKIQLFDALLRYQTDLLLSAIWICIPISLFFILALAGSGSLFSPRYWVWVSPAVALFATLLVLSTRHSKVRRISAALLLILLLVRETGRRWVLEDWRSAAQLALQAQKQNVDISLLLYPGLVEVENTAWRTSESYYPYLNAPLKVYQPSLNPRLVGVTESSHSETEQLFKNVSKKSVVLVFLKRKIVPGDARALFTDDYFTAVSAEAGYNVQTLTDQKDLVQVWRLLPKVPDR